MKRKAKFAAALLVLVLAGCATAAGGLIGGGVDRASGGDGTAGAMIGAGAGMMIDIFD
ncbi:hypothetical protein [Bordetella hinzii]|uniref:Lipoprotein n=1 Tax=Bordetella hinzii OH87 BAL007II TaxID=1331262 RepID=A0ABR4R2W3_9BORD|nr:hypothetical protein [Bordetella hinzii]AKQ55638.1 hypothetical protein ACR54_02323 [Bordetella hinzii]AKQ60141.1 hypothetical protein ACR55_02273 [Bordetella hinzii]KCB24640.1 putative lipoprotein [Bordetella hinzii OH87 BAL007II]KCB30857.1 putative lipoprotein [Bordetella hinzii CA90 BAL1384]KCB33904.1 putative lipoprotein [Bordetella hinzii L60]